MVTVWPLRQDRGYQGVCRSQNWHQLQLSPTTCSRGSRNRIWPRERSLETCLLQGYSCYPGQGLLASSNLDISQLRRNTLLKRPLPNPQGSLFPEDMLLIFLPMSQICHQVPVSLFTAVDCLYLPKSSLSLTQTSLLTGLLFLAHPCSTILHTAGGIAFLKYKPDLVPPFVEFFSDFLPFVLSFPRCSRKCGEEEGGPNGALLILCLHFSGPWLESCSLVHRLLTTSGLHCLLPLQPGVEREQSDSEGAGPPHPPELQQAAAG